MDESTHRFRYLQSYYRSVIVTHRLRHVVNCINALTKTCVIVFGFFWCSHALVPEAPSDAPNSWVLLTFSSNASGCRYPVSLFIVELIVSSSTSFHFILHGSKHLATIPHTIAHFVATKGVIRALICSWIIVYESPFIHILTWLILARIFLVVSKSLQVFWLLLWIWMHVFLLEFER